MNWKQGLKQTGVPSAIGAALLFGAGTPLAKLLLDSVSPWLLAGLLYLGSGIGLSIYRLINRAPAIRLPANEVVWFAGAIASGGVIAPVLLMIGLIGMPASGASLLLNTEGVFTALLAWFVFKENFDRRIALGMAVILAGVAVLSWPGSTQLTQAGLINAGYAELWPTLAILGACFAWGLDNNLTRKVSLTDASWIASVKGLVAGIVNLLMAFALGASLPSIPTVASAMFTGFMAYGVSLSLFVIALRHLGTARTGAYFSVAPFFGALLAVALGEPLTLPLLVAGALMAIGIWLHLTERHEHRHVHTSLEHEHTHAHDAHHLHTHNFPIKAGEKHSHKHKHSPLEHKHPHFPDGHHQHRH